MAVEKELKAVADALITLRRDNLRTLARAKALEAMIRESIPKDKSDAWDDRLDKQTKFILQHLLESFEKQNAGYATRLDDRKDWELSDEG
jgi:ribosomal protein L17